MTGVVDGSTNNCELYQEPFHDLTIWQTFLVMPAKCLPGHCGEVPMTILSHGIGPHILKELIVLT